MRGPGINRHVIALHASYSHSFSLISGCGSVSHLSSVSGIIAEKPVHRYSTRANEARVMDQVQKDLAEMRERMDQFMHLMTGMAQGQERLREMVERPTQVPDIPIVTPGGGPVPIPGGGIPGGDAGGGPVPVNNAVGNGTGGPGARVLQQDLQDEQFTILDGVDEAHRRIEEISEKMKSFECRNILGFDVSNLGLVHDVQIPHKFKPPSFEKYDGTSCPKTHLQSYIGRLRPYTPDEKLWIYFFDNSLTGAPRDWYSHLTRDTIRSWTDLAQAFVKQYQYNVDMAPNRTMLQGMSQDQKESFRVYAQRWRQAAAAVQPPMAERELTDLFLGTLQGVYADRLTVCSATSFADIVIAGERLESGLKQGRIQDHGASSSGTKKPFAASGHQRRREGEANAVYSGQGQNRGRGRPNYYQGQVAAVMVPAPAPQPIQAPLQIQQPQQQQPQYQQRPRYNNNQGNQGQRQYQRAPRQERVIDPLPMPYSVILPQLLKLNMVELRTLAPPDPLNMPRNYDANARCAFHSNAPGHTLENCKAFQMKVQDLIDAKAVSFAPTPNVTQNPMPNHGVPRINAVEDGKSLNLVSDISKVQTPLAIVKDRLLKGQVFPGCGETCEGCEKSENGCEKLRTGIQSLITEGSLQFDQQSSVQNNDVSTVVLYPSPEEVYIPETPPPATLYYDAPAPVTLYYDPPSSAPVTLHHDISSSSPAVVSPVIITTPGPVPYTSENAIPWHYGADLFCNGQKVEDDQPASSNSQVDNVGGVGGFTRSGRLFAPQTLRTNPEAEAAARIRGKQVVTEEIFPDEAQKSSFEKDVEEFMRIIKKSDYKVVDHLNQTPSKISILSLLMCSEAHRNALLKVLNMAYVPEEITVNQLESVVAGVNASHGLGFTDRDLTTEGRNHNKALHITMECKGAVLSHVLVDTGSSLNVLPKKALIKLDCDGITLRPSNLVVRAFDGSKRAVCGEVELPVKIGLQVFKSTFYVMDIQPAYSCLLGRPWIHAAGAVTSTLHQKLKYESEGQVVTVCGEEDIFVSHLSTFKYVEMDGEIHEMLCQGFEAVNVNEATSEEKFIPKVEREGTSIASYKQALEVVQAGNAQGWGTFVEPVEKKDKFGLGYDPCQFLPKKAAKATFSSGGLVSPDHINAAEDDADSDCDFDNWIRPCVPGQELANWSSEDIIRVTMYTE